MPSPTPVVSAPVTVRLDHATKTALVALGETSKRPVSQLVREATGWWLSIPDRTCPVGQVADPDGHGTVMAVRFPVDMFEQVQAECDRTRMTVSGVIRCAVRGWLDAVDPQALGTPVGLTTTTHAASSPAAAGTVVLTR